MNLFQQFQTDLESGTLVNNARKRIIYQCRTCGKVRTCQYIQYPLAPSRLSWLRFDPRCLGTPETDLRCPCGSMKVKASEVIAVETDHACTEECRRAKTSVCRCSCKGLHHAEIYEVKGETHVG